MKYGIENDNGGPPIDPESLAKISENWTAAVRIGISRATVSTTKRDEADYGIGLGLQPTDIVLLKPGEVAIVKPNSEAIYVAPGPATGSGRQ